MIDTVILSIPREQYKILDPYRFNPNAVDFLRGGRYFSKSVNNPNPQEKKDGVYLPRLTLFKRPTKHDVEIPLKMEFSVPKLLYSNNVDEVNEEDLSLVVSTLQDKLKHMGDY